MKTVKIMILIKNLGQTVSEGPSILSRTREKWRGICRKDNLAWMPEKSRQWDVYLLNIFIGFAYCLLASRHSCALKNLKVWHYSSQSLVNIKTKLGMQTAFQIKPSWARGVRKEIGSDNADLGCWVEGGPINLTFAVISDSEYDLETQLLLYSYIIFSAELSKHLISDGQATQSWPLASVTDFALNVLWVIETTWAAISADHSYSLCLMGNTYWMVIIFAQSHIRHRNITFMYLQSKS